MRPTDFTSRAPGQLITLDSEGAAFVPHPLPPQLHWDGALVRLIGEAERALGELNGVGRRLPNPYLFTRPFINREAVLSSRIEGTQASLSDLYALEAQVPLFPELEVREDAQEVQNYVRALEHGLSSTLPISTRLLREMHAVLMSGVRGQNRAPGELRRSQNWIGPAGARRRDATFVPAPPGPLLEGALNDLERFIHAQNDLPPLVEIALVHYQFEALHPFLDGNGRVGRLLITLLLIQRQLLTQPLLYLSAYFERHRSAYYEHLLAVSQRGEWEAWLAFFLRGVEREAGDAALRAQRLLDLREAWRARYQQERAGSNLLAATDRLLAQPITTAGQLQHALGVVHRSAQLIVDRLLRDGVLVEVTGRQRGRVYMARPVLELLELEQVSEQRPTPGNPIQTLTEP
ncbi:Fic family protein [Deinococcus multiflagellatus]|uniref:Fic family protein n=1 Tax=Deinococcus multiflagellatus TaxID=1656887 RepID=A0ABW1ZLD9_9DEIO|nr:Fic family protein [Deinococcus multiflagellatus]MBZ9713951.1 Fic family protein [Deinococcus multiflagellatus]